MIVLWLTRLAFILPSTPCIQDFIRSGMTCIKFFMGFQGRATTMNDLYSRRRFLNTAKQHFLQAINDKHHQHLDTGRRGSRMAGGGVRPVEESSRLSLTLTKNMSPEDLQVICGVRVSVVVSVKLALCSKLLFLPSIARITYAPLTCKKRSLSSSIKPV